MKNTIYIEKRLHSAIRFSILSIAIIMLILSIAMIKANAQTFVEQTIFGVQKGFSLGVQHHGNFGLAHFCRSTRFLHNEIGIRNERYDARIAVKSVFGEMVQAGLAHNHVFIAAPKMVSSISWKYALKPGSLWNAIQNKPLSKCAFI